MVAIRVRHSGSLSFKQHTSELSGLEEYHMNTLACSLLLSKVIVILTHFGGESSQVISFTVPNKRSRIKIAHDISQEV